MRKRLAIAVQLMTVLAMLLAACSSPAAPQATPQPQTVKETVIVTQEVPVVKVTEVEKIVEKAPSEYALTVLNPQGAVTAAKELAPRLPSLDGKKVAFWLSATADETYAGMGGPLYDELMKMLKDKYPAANIVSYTELPQKYSPANEVIHAITATVPDAVVVGFGG